MGEKNDTTARSATYITITASKRGITEVVTACTKRRKDNHTARIGALMQYPIMTTGTRQRKGTHHTSSPQTSISFLLAILPVHPPQTSTPNPPLASTRISIQKTPASRSKNHSLAANIAKTNNAFERRIRGMSLFGILVYIK